MKGWLIVNGFLQGKKYSTIYHMLKIACKNKNIELELKTNSEILAKIGFLNKSPEVDFVLFWDKDIKLCKYLEQCGYSVFNSSKAIEICDDKALTALALQNTKIKMPKTILAPKTFDNIGYTNFDFIDNAIAEIGFPMVIKECFGSFGNEVYLVKNRNELNQIIKGIGTKPFIFQELIKSSCGRDIRVHTVGNQVVTAVKRIAKEGEFVANVSSGGTMVPYTLTDNEKLLVFDITKALSIDFAGIDLLFGENGEKILCEVNTNAHFKNLFYATNINVADYIIEYIRGKI